MVGASKRGNFARQVVEIESAKAKKGPNIYRLSLICSDHIVFFRQDIVPVKTKSIYNYNNKNGIYEMN